MAYQTVFKRYEMKYLLTKGQKELILEAMYPYMKLDNYGRSTIRNIYYDTDNYRLIRESIEGPEYKEKLRVRSYVKADDDSTVFVEIKKKYDSIVYKRRIPLKEKEVTSWINKKEKCSKESQITREIDYFMNYYKDLKPKVFLSYEREAYFMKDGSDFRVTFDEEILCRQTDLTLKEPVWGTKILDEDKVLMEIKCSKGMPLWMAKVLSKNGIGKTSFSKYGTAYKQLIFPRIKTGG